AESSRKGGSMPQVESKDVRGMLSQLNFLCEGYGTEDFSVFLYSLVKMFKCKNVIELGTGWGNCAYWMSLALKENGGGSLWTYDNGGHFRQIRPTGGIPLSLKDAFGIEIPAEEGATLYFSILSRLAEKFGLERYFNQVRADVDLQSFGSTPGPWQAEKVDLVFADFQHDPMSILRILSGFLPWMSDSSHIFVDSASTKLGSYLTLEQTIPRLNLGLIPGTVNDLCPEEKREALNDFVLKHRFT